MLEVKGLGFSVVAPKILIRTFARMQNIYDCVLFHFSHGNEKWQKQFRLVMDFCQILASLISIHNFFHMKYL